MMYFQSGGEVLVTQRVHVGQPNLIDELLEDGTLLLHVLLVGEVFQGYLGAVGPQVRLHAVLFH